MDARDYGFGRRLTTARDRFDFAFAIDIFNQDAEGVFFFRNMVEGNGMNFDHAVGDFLGRRFRFPWGQLLRGFDYFDLIGLRVELEVHCRLRASNYREQGSVWLLQKIDQAEDFELVNPGLKLDGYNQVPVAVERQGLLQVHD
ncbi:hypothetical protein ES703_25807 [subsurface metagenome]